MNLYLIGYRGSGKSTVAPLVATALNREFIDTDVMIEQQTHLSISEIFSQQGEWLFRQLESTLIESFDAGSDLVVSLGGGAPLAEVNRNWMAQNGKTIWLTAPPTILFKRISGDSSSAQRRPNLTEQGGLDEIEAILAARTPVYNACADYTIDVSEMSPKHIAERIVTWWLSVDK